MEDFGITVPVLFSSPRVPIQFSFVDNDVYELTSVVTLTLSMEQKVSGAVIEEPSTTIKLLDDDSKDTCKEKDSLAH